MVDRIILVVDTETTGFSPRIHEIIDLWAIALDVKDLSVRWQAGGRVVPDHIESASASALEVNRYDAEEWKADGAQSLQRVWKRVTDNYSKETEAILCGHNVGFDQRFLESNLSRLGLISIWWGHPLIDTASLAMKDLRAGRIKDRSLESLAGFCVPSGVIQGHWPPDARHGAKADARITAAVLRGQLYPERSWCSGWEEQLWDDEPVVPNVWPRGFFWGADKKS